MLWLTFPLTPLDAQISQDDGPLPPGRALNNFFKEKKIAATHFYIGECWRAAADRRCR